jgi:hypothetical protein
MQTGSLNVSCYSVRRLSPFRGLLHVVDVGDARAVTSDGIGWPIQLSVEYPLPRWGGLGPVRRRCGHVVAGVCSQRAGYAGFPLDPVLDAPAFDRQAQVMAELLSASDRPPSCEPADHHELRLLDADNRPLVLAASARKESDCRRRTEASWLPTAASDLAFESPTLRAHPKLARRLCRPSPWR